MTYQHALLLGAVAPSSGALASQTMEELQRKVMKFRARACPARRAAVG